MELNGNPASRVIQKICKAREISTQESREKENLGFLTQCLVQTTFPHSDPGDVKVWQRHNGNLTLSLKPDWKKDKLTGEEVCIGVPYGTIPRLLLYWINTQCIKTKSPRIILGDSLASFMRELGISRSGRDIKRLKEQMKRLLRSRISFEKEGLDSTDEIDMLITKRRTLFWTSHPQDANKKVLWENEFVLSEEFYEAIKRSPVPINMDVLREIRSSSLLLDFYIWLIYRSYKENDPNGIFLKWSLLEKQIGTEYQRPTHFSEKAREAIKRIKFIDTNLKIETGTTGFTLYPSKDSQNKQLPLKYTPPFTKA